MSRRVIIYAESGILTVVQKRNNLLPWSSSLENTEAALSSVEYDRMILIEDILVPEEAQGVEEEFFNTVVDVLLVSGGFKIDLKGILTLKTFNHKNHKFLELLSKLHKGSFT